MGVNTIGFLAGLDIGYGNVKGIGGAFQGAEVKEFVLPAGAAPVSAMPKRGLTPDLKGGELVCLIDEDWVAGVEQHHIQGGVRQTHAEYVGTKEYLALYLAALSRFNVPRIRRLVTGLPVSQFYGPGNLDLIQKMKNVMVGTHQVTAMKQVQIDEVVVVSQPAGTFMGLAARPEYGFLATKADLSVLVVDVGYYSVDFVSMSGRSVQDKFSNSSQLATSHILEETARSLTQSYGRVVSRDRLDMLVRNNETHIGLGSQDVDFMSVMRVIGDGVAERVCSEIMATMRNAKTGIDVIILTGGGGFLFEEAIGKKFPMAQLILNKEPVLGNVRGYFSIAQFQESQSRRAATASVG